VSSRGAKREVPGGGGTSTPGLDEVQERGSIEKWGGRAIANEPIIKRKKNTEETELRK